MENTNQTIEMDGNYTPIGWHKALVFSVWREGYYANENFSPEWEGVKELIGTGGKVSRPMECYYSYSGKQTFKWHGESYSSPMTATSYTAVEIAVPEGTEVPAWFAELIPFE